MLLTTNLKNNNMETTRQRKVARQIQKDVSEIFTREAAGLLEGAMVSVTVVRVSADLSFAKLYLSVFPFEKNEAVLHNLAKNHGLLRKALGDRVRKQLRIVPELFFISDDSLEYIENIENLLK
jgi:ribosome-binding factor A